MKRMNRLGLPSFQIDSSGRHFETDQDPTNEMADYFVDISNGFLPVDSSFLDLVPPKATFVSEVDCHPSEHEVYGVLQAAKKTSSVKNDFPTAFLEDFLPFLAKPAQFIFIHSINDGRLNM